MFLLDHLNDYSIAEAHIVVENDFADVVQQASYVCVLIADLVGELCQMPGSIRHHQRVPPEFAPVQSIAGQPLIHRGIHRSSENDIADGLIAQKRNRLRNVGDVAGHTVCGRICELQYTQN